MKKCALVLATAATLSQPGYTFQLDTSDDWAVRWDNSVKFNVMSRVAKQDKDVYTPRAGAGWFAADDSDLSVDRSNLGLVSTRLDLVSEFDLSWRDQYGFRISAAGWYDPQYRDSNNDHPRDRQFTWGSPSVAPGEYSDEAKDMHYLGGELLDAFVFGNWEFSEDSALGVRAGRHTIYWGQGLLLGGAIHGIGGAMAPLDLNKALSVPGSEARELYMPTGKLSGVWQINQNLTLNAYYGYEFQAYRLPETGTYWSPAEGLTEESEFLTLLPGELFRSGFQMRGYDDDTGDYGINLQYYVEPWSLETSFVYINYTDMNLHGLVGALGSANTPPPDPDAGVVYLGEAKWVFKNDVELYGLAFAREIAGVSVGMDIVYRKNTGLGPDLRKTLLRPGFDLHTANPDNTAAAVGDTWHLVINAFHLLNSDWGLWDGGSAIVEASFSMLDECKKNCEYLDDRINESRVVSQISGLIRPTWYQVRSGWDLSLPVSFAYTIDGEKSPLNLGGDEEGGSASIGVSLDIKQTWLVTLAYNDRFGPVLAGTGGLLKDRDNVSLTIKRTF